MLTLTSFVLQYNYKDYKKYEMTVKGISDLRITPTNYLVPELGGVFFSFFSFIHTESSLAKE